MQHTHTELNELVLEFRSVRESGIRRFPEAIWKKAISLTKKIPIEEISSAINVSVSYLQRKSKDLAVNLQPVRFVEAVPQFLSSSDIVVIVQTSKGHSMKIEGINSSSLIDLMSGFFKGDSTCSK